MSERTREPEFYANATLGFRQWSLSLEATGEPSLKATVRRGFHLPCYRWNPQGPNHAECPRLKLGPGSFHVWHGVTPGPKCSCGFYAYGRRHGSGSETTVHTVGGVIAAWENLELHEKGFRCSAAKILAFFEPDPEARYADYHGLARRKRAALEEICSAHSIPLLAHDALIDEEELRRYAAERDLALLEDQLRAESPWPALKATEGEDEWVA